MTQQSEPIEEPINQTKFLIRAFVGLTSLIVLSCAVVGYRIHTDSKGSTDADCVVLPKDPA